MEVGRQTTPKGKGKGKSTKQAAVLKTDNRTETPEIKKDEGVENPDKDALESTDTDAVDVPDTEAEGTGAPSTGDAENQGPLAGDTRTEDGKNGVAVAAVLEIDVEQAGTGKFVDEALDRARDNEKQAFQNLINENVKTQSELDKTSARLADIEAQLAEKKIELESEQEKNRELRAQMHDLETTVKEYEEEKRRAAAEAAAAAGTAAEEDESKPPESGEEEIKNDEFITTEQRLKDLQLRLKRMARDEEEKDQYVAELTRQLKVSEDVLDDLEPHVDKVRWQEVMDKRRTALEEQVGEPMATAEWLGSDNVVRRSDGVAKSKICVIM